MSFVKEKYNNEVKDSLLKEFKYESVMQVPKLDKVVINMGLGEAAANSKIIEEAVEELKVLSGQKPVVTKAKNSIAGFKLREEQPIGAKVTLRGENMFNFLDKFLGIALPRVRDFQGLNPKACDGIGNYTCGIQEQIIFPEIDFDKVKRTTGMDITIVTTATNNEEGLALLRGIGVPFIKKGE